MNPTHANAGRDRFGRRVTFKRLNGSKAEVFADNEVIGLVLTARQPRRGAAMTTVVNAKYGSGIAESLGFGEEDAFTAHDKNGRPLNGHKYSRAIQAAMIVAQSAR